MTSDIENGDGNSGFRDLRQGPALWPKEPKPSPEFFRYPIYLTHPEHVDAVPDEFHEQRNDDGALIRWSVPGNPEKWPPLIVHDEEQEAHAVARGYLAPVCDEAIVAAYCSPPQGPTGAVTEYPKYIAAHNKIVNSEAEEIALLPPAERGAAEAARAARRPTLVDCGGDVERYAAEVMRWTLAQQATAQAAVPQEQATPVTPNIGARNRSEAQARRAAGVSQAEWRKLIRAGFLDAARQTDPVAIIAAQEAMRQAEDAARIATEQDFTTDQRI